jgi:hypothetical protein
MWKLIPFRWSEHKRLGRESVYAGGSWRISEIFFDNSFLIWKKLSHNFYLFREEKKTFQLLVSPRNLNCDVKDATFEEKFLWLLIHLCRDDGFGSQAGKISFKIKFQNFHPPTIHVTVPFPLNPILYTSPNLHKFNLHFLVKVS